MRFLSLLHLSKRYLETGREGQRTGMLWDIPAVNQKELLILKEELFHAISKKPLDMACLYAVCSGTVYRHGISCICIRG